MKHLVLQIADLKILINFIQREKKVMNLLESMIKKIYRPFILDQIIQEPHFTIEVVDKNIIPLDFIRDDMKKTIETYGNFYERRMQAKIITYYHIGIEQFHYLLTHIIERLLFKHSGFMVQGQMKEFGLLLKPSTPELQLIIIRKFRGDFFGYPFPKFIDLKNNSRPSDKVKLKSIFMVKNKLSSSIKEIKNKESLISQLSHISNIFNMQKFIEYKQYTNYSVKTLFDFIQKSRFYLVSPNIEVDQLNKYFPKNGV